MALYMVLPTASGCRSTRTTRSSSAAFPAILRGAAWKKRAATGSRSTCSNISKRGPSGRNRPKRLHDALPHADVPVVEIHRGVAVAGHQQELLAERGRGSAWRDVYPSVLVRRGCVHEPGLLPDARHARVDARRLEAGVDDGALRRGPAHHRGEHEQRVLEARQRSGPFVARVVGVHEDVGAGLDLVPRARFHLEHEAAAAGAGDDGTGNSRFLTGGGSGSFMFEVESGAWNEIQPGSYVFMDADYARNEWAAPLPRFEHSLFVLATVMSRPAPDRAIVDAGLKASSVDSGMPSIWQNPGLQYAAASDEHGRVDIAPGVAAPALGEKLLLVPGHCDPTVNLYDWYVCVRQGVVEALWPITARGASL